MLTIYLSGKLILKIPFKDMWNGQIDAIIEELFILIVPTSQVAYIEEKESKIQLEAKRAELARVEKRKQLANIKCYYLYFLMNTKKNLSEKIFILLAYDAYTTISVKVIKLFLNSIIKQYIQ